MVTKKFMLSIVSALALSSQVHSLDDWNRKQEVAIEKLSNGMMYCIADNKADDDISVKLFVKFDHRWKSQRERLISSLLEKLILDSVTSNQTSLESAQVSIAEPELFAVPNLILYKLDIHNPNQEVLDLTFSHLSKTFEDLAVMNVDELVDKIEYVINQNHDQVKPRQPFFVDDPLYPGASLIGFEDACPPITSAEVKDFYHAYYRPENMMFFVCGDVDNLAVKETIEHFFSSFVELHANLIPDSYADAEFILQSNEDPELMDIMLASNVETKEFKAEIFSQVEEASNASAKTFYDLPIQDSERNTIQRIIHTMATQNVMKLLWKKKDLEKMGKNINHVHPLRFLWSILDDPKLRSDLQVIRGDFFKWNGFLDGFRRRMTEEYYNDNIANYIPGFCEDLKLSEDIIMHFIVKKDWEGLVKASM